MTVLYPGAEWKPLGPQTQGRMRSHSIICLHTMVGSLAGTHSMFKANGYGGTESHFGVGHNGTTYQWQDLDFSADANLSGSRDVISIETADFGEGPFGRWDTKGDNVPPWTAQQIEALAKIIAWCCKRYDIPCVLIPDSKTGRRGIGFHAQGVPRKSTDTVSQTGGVLWSKAAGKVCPGRRRIAQIPLVIHRARLIMGVTITTPIVVEERVFMHLTEAEEKELLLGVREIVTSLRKTKPGQKLPARSVNARTKDDDEYGHVLNGGAEAADGRVAAEKSLRAVQDLTLALKAKGIL
jgi:hypothetical protein